MKTLKQLILFLLVTCIMVFALSTTVMREIYKKVLFDNTYRTTVSSLRQIEYNFTEKQEYLFSCIARVLSSEELKNLAMEEEFSVYSYKAVNEFNHIVLEILNYSEEVASVLYVNQDGMMVGTDGGTVWKEKRGEALEEKLRTIPEGISFQGGFHSALFYQNREYMKKKPEEYITVSVPYKYAQEPLKEGILLFNLKETAFRNIYAAMLSDNSGGIYILDDKGNILSSTREELIQTRYPYWQEMDGDKKEAYFTRDGIYSISYEMEKLNWWMVWEKPVTGFYAEVNQLYRILLGFVFCSMLLVLAGYGLYVRVLLKPLRTLMTAMENIGQGHYGIRIEEKIEGEIGKVIQSFNSMSGDIELLTRENVRINNEKRTLQLLALQEQMSPHFVLNALNTIKWMAIIAGEDNIVNMVISLSKIIHAFKNTNAFGTIAEEIDFIRHYIIVMNYRYGDVITVHYDLQQSLSDVRIPIFFIQPLVENSLKHGFESTNCKGDIYIAAREEEGLLHIRVTDNGKGMSPDKREELNRRLKEAGHTPLVDTGGVGLLNIAKRMQIYYGEKSDILVSAEGGGTRVELILPYRETE